MKRSVAALILMVTLAIVGAAAAEGVEPVTRPADEAPAGAAPAPGAGDGPALAELFDTPEPIWLGNCSRYAACVCSCEYQLTACLEAFGQNCYDEYYACHDVCIERWVSDGTQCGGIIC